jgi:hypothetical protein
MYEIRGQYYLEGTLHEAKILSGVKCEIFVEVTFWNHLRRFLA